VLPCARHELPAKPRVRRSPSKSGARRRHASSAYKGPAEGVETGLISVPSLQDRAGNLSDIGSSLTGTVSGPYLASLLSQKLGYVVSTGEPYYTADWEMRADDFSMALESITLT
jgi:hypothetical protein